MIDISYPNKFHLLLFTLFFYLNLTDVAQAQPAFIRYDSIPVVVSGDTLRHPWAGGLNFCHFSNIDYNGDGANDLFIFDRSGNRILPFISEGISGSSNFRYAPELRDSFPVLHDWVLLVDYNCDGKADIFTYSDMGGGIAVYKNISPPGGLRFELVTPLLLTFYNPNTLNLYVSAIGFPGLIDVDNDGDLDALVFSVLGNFVEYHQNQSMELYGHCDSLVFRLADACWGNFEENLSNNSGNLGISCKGGSGTYATQDAAHAGSCIMAFDSNGDGLKDILLSNISFNSVTLLVNGGTLLEANITSQEVLFPQSDVPMNLVVYPGTFYVDVNNDGKRDLIGSPNAQNISENFRSIHYYRNMATDAAPQFSFQESNFLQNEMIETGEGAYPVFFDADADGKLDLIIGNYGYKTGNAYSSSLSYYRNTGTVSQPVFELITRDFGNLSLLGLRGIFATFGDVDADGDADMIIGETEGNIHLLLNSAGAGNPAIFSLSQANYQGIDVGQFSAPQLFDIDNDNLLDLIIGERNGNLNYYRNTGTAQNAIFSLQTEFLGGVDVRIGSSTLGYSTPYMFKQNGITYLMVGSEAGNIFLYDSISDNLSGNFHLLSNQFMNIKEGTRTSPTLFDINGDGFFDMVIGNYSGGVSFFKSDTSGLNSIEDHALDNQIEFDLFPNPSVGGFNIVLKKYSFSTHQISIRDLSGRLIIQKSFAGEVNQFYFPELIPGCYFVNIHSAERNGNKKLIIQPY